MADPRPRWLLRRRPRPKAPVRMYCFPHSGGSPGEYLAWSDSLPDIEVWGVQLPGRGGRLGEPPFTDMATLVDALLSEVELIEPFVFFGHSLGALVAYETACALREAGRPGPQQLYLSGYRAAHLHRPRTDLHRLDGPALVAAIEAEHGPLPTEITSDPELLEMVLPALRADLTIVAGYRYRPTAPLPCGITVLGGTEDSDRGDLLTAWRLYTTGPFAVRTFSGDHFYFRERTNDVLRYLGDQERAAGALRRSRALGPAAPVPGTGPG